MGPVYFCFPREDNHSDYDVRLLGYDAKDFGAGQKRKKPTQDVGRSATGGGETIFPNFVSFLNPELYFFLLRKIQ